MPSSTSEAVPSGITNSDPAASPASPPVGHAGEVLIVDDTPDNLRLLSRILSNAGYDVRKALTGEMALTSARARAPDLILLDIRMPYMDGYEVCEQLKADPQLADIPVIFISALSETWDKVKAFSMGAVDYITKPFQTAEVLARVRTHIQLRQAQKQLHAQNQQLRHLNEELTRSNQELDQFAYVVSHDLQQPLQSITGFVSLIHLKYWSILDAEAQDYLTRIKGAGQRMQRLIQDLLAYARAGNQTTTFAAIDCNDLLNDTLANLQTLLVEKGATIAHDHLPTVMGNYTQLGQLLQNLITNAIKFVPPQQSPHVRIDVSPHAEQWLFSVQDNGIGISPEHLERIFEAFQRCHADQNYSGTGIGLATCKRIVELHGGRIWAESQVGEGTTFYFTLKA